MNSKTLKIRHMYGVRWSPDGEVAVTPIEILKEKPVTVDCLYLWQNNPWQIDKNGFTCTFRRNIRIIDIVKVKQFEDYNPDWLLPEKDYNEIIRGYWVGL